MDCPHPAALFEDINWCISLQKGEDASFTAKKAVSIFQGHQFETALTTAFNFIGHLGSKDSTAESIRRDGWNLTEDRIISIPRPMNSVSWNGMSSHMAIKHDRGGSPGLESLMSSVGLGRSEEDLEPISDLTVDELLPMECIIGGTSQAHLMSSYMQLPRQCDVDVGDRGLQILHNLFEESYHKLCRSSILAAKPNLRGFLSDFQALVTTALEVLRKVLCWKHLPTAGIEVYAVLHFAYASALYANPRNICIIHENMYADVSHWSLAVDIRERTLFRAVFDRIWCPQQSSVRDASWTDVVNETEVDYSQNVSLPHVPTDLLYGYTILDPEEFCVSPKTIDQDYNVSLDSLLGGIAILMCRQYLDIVESTNLHVSLQIVQRPLMEPDPCVPLNLEHLNAITGPLLTRDYDVFYLLVKKHKDMLEDGASSNVREFELSLIHGARAVSESPELYDTFLRKVLKLCDTIYLKMNNDPYIRYHVALAFLVHRWKAIAEQLQPFMTSTSRTASDGSDYTMQSSVDERPSTGISSNSSYSQRNISLPELVLLGKTLSEVDSKGKQRAHEARLNRTTSLPLSSSPSAASPAGDLESNITEVRKITKTCPNCNKSFGRDGGNPRFASQNLSRHQNTACKRGSVSTPRLPCRYCGKTFSRQDNRKTHVDRLHRDQSFPENSE